MQQLVKSVERSRVPKPHDVGTVEQVLEKIEQCNEIICVVTIYL